MAVRNTEKWIPGGFTLENALKLGPATISEDENYILVSYLDSPLRLGKCREKFSNTYVLFVNIANTTAPASYSWQFTCYCDDTSIPMQPEQTTDIGVYSFDISNSDIPFDYITKIEVMVKPAGTQIELKITHTVMNLFPVDFNTCLNAKFDAENGNPPISRKIANDYRNFILEHFDGSSNDLFTGDINVNLLITVIYLNVYNTLPDKLKEAHKIWEDYLNKDIVTDNLPTLSLGIAQIKPHLLAMFIPPFLGTLGTVMVPQIWDPSTATKAEYSKQMFDAFHELTSQSSRKNDKINIYNSLRFPKRCISMALTYLENLKARGDRYGDLKLTKEDYSNNKTCIVTIVSEYQTGPVQGDHQSTAFADETYSLMYSHFITKLTMNEVIITRNSHYIRMMTNEFHDDVEGVFNPQEPQNFLKRLTLQQRDLLFKNEVIKNRLTAFIIFGDGYAERLMGASFNNNYIVDTSGSRRKEILKDCDNVRPNASFALFNKFNGSTSEMVFYTRFFTISYRSGKDNYPDKGYTGAFEARLTSRSLMNEVITNASEYNYYSPTTKDFITNLSTMDKEKKIETFFAELSKMELFQDFAEVTTKNPTKHLLSIIGEFAPDLSHACHESPGDGTKGAVPYIAIKTESGETPDIMVLPFGDPPTSENTNTIHGTLNTKGCWMMLRNHLWNWPKENEKINGRYDLYELFSRVKIILEKPSMYLGDLPNLEYPLTEAFNHYQSGIGGSAVDKGITLGNWWKNLTYFEFVNRFLEYQYKKEDKYYYSFPSNSVLDRNGNTGGNNIFKKQNRERIENCRYKKGSEHDDWADLYLFKLTDRFTKDENDTDPFDCREPEDTE